MKELEEKIIQADSLETLEKVRVELFGKLLEENIEVKLDFTSEPCIASMDPNQLQQIMLNLALNSRDAMPDGGIITVEIFLASCPAEVNPVEVNGRCIHIRVTDTGYGMSSEVKAKAFEPFFTTKQRGKGTGLGLSITRGIVQRHGGQITCHSKVAQGTVFVVKIPVNLKS